MNEISARPWGTYEVIMSSDSYKIKRIIVEPGQRLSIESHANTLKYGESIQIKRNEKHRVKNISVDKLILIEVQTGSILKETDIVRYQDVYGRVN